MAFLNFIRVHVLGFAVIILNVLYFIPKTLKYLKWESGITMGYAGIELILNYLIHIFFIYSCISLLNEYSKKYEKYLFITLISIFLVSFVFAFRIIEYVVLIPLFLYIIVFYILFNKIKMQKNIHEIHGIGLVVSIVWLILDQKFFG